MTESVCFWGFIGGAIGMMPGSHICHLNCRLAEPTHSAAQSHKAGVQVWSSAADKSDRELIRGPACLKLRRCWAAPCVRSVTIWDVLTHLLCQSHYRFSIGSRHLDQLHILFLCKQSWCLFQFYIFTQKSSVYMWVIEKVPNSTVWYDCSLIVVFRLCNFIKICRVQFPSIISAFKIPTELSLQEA